MLRFHTLIFLLGFEVSSFCVLIKSVSLPQTGQLGSAYMQFAVKSAQMYKDFIYLQNSVLWFIQILTASVTERLDTGKVNEVCLVSSTAVAVYEALSLNLLTSRIREGKRFQADSIPEHARVFGYFSRPGGAVWEAKKGTKRRK